MQMRADYKALFIEQACCMSQQGLKQRLGAWKRWHAHCSKDDMRPTEARKIKVAPWLKSLKKKGKTAPRGAHAALKRACALLRIDLELDDRMVKAQALCARSQVEKTAIPFRIKVWMLWEREVASSNAYVSAICLAWLLLIMGVTRYAHLWRATLLEGKKSYMTLEASSGKAKCEGVRKPTRWSVPNTLMCGADLSAIVHKYVAERGEECEEASFWLPDLVEKLAT